MFLVFLNIMNLKQKEEKDNMRIKEFWVIEIIKNKFILKTFILNRFIIIKMMMILLINILKYCKIKIIQSI